MDSFVRATTYSFGSICFGSLLVAIVQALRTLLDIARSQDDDGCNILVCLLQCILGCIEGIIEELNKWAYVYVGLYGYRYVLQILSFGSMVKSYARCDVPFQTHPYEMLVYIFLSLRIAVISRQVVT